MQSPNHTPRIAVYPGTFDPVTNGHLDLVDRALKLFDKVVIAIGINPVKESLFTLEERLEMVRETIGTNGRVEINSSCRQVWGLRHTARIESCFGL
jgi:pantetheine-phosphate adenylyltransferase